MQRQLQRVDLGALVWREVDELGRVRQRLVVTCASRAELHVVDGALEKLGALLLVLGHEAEPVGKLELACVVVLIFTVGSALGGSGGRGHLERLLLGKLVSGDGRLEGGGGGLDPGLQLGELRLEDSDVGTLRLIRIQPVLGRIEQRAQRRCVYLLSVLS